MTLRPNRRPDVCSQCHRPFPPALPVHGPVRQRIVDLIANRPDGITRAELLDLVYSADPDGGPENPNTISVLVKFANRDLAPLGFHIWASGGPGSRYYLRRSA
jgi:hypothetical protein